MVDENLDEELNKIENLAASPDSKPDEFAKRNSISSQEEMMMQDGDGQNEGADDLSELEGYAPNFDNIYINEDRGAQVKKSLEN